MADIDLTRIKRDDPVLEGLELEELVLLLPKRLQAEIKRANWSFEHIDELAEKEILDPNSHEPIRNRRISREEILLLFDPPYNPHPDLNEEDNLLAYISSDPVLWARFELGLNPRLYQILMLRDPNIRLVLRLGRRCGKSATIAIRILWRSLTDGGHASLVVCPMKPHVDVLWEMMKTFLRRNEEYADMMKSRKITTSEQPHYQMTFPNGSVANMFTSGVKSKNKADTVRGQEADDVYMDEVDLMSVDDFAAISSIMRDTGRSKEHGVKTLLVASTPNGRRDMLYRFCTEFTQSKERPYTEYYFPTHADINYTRSDDAEQRMILTREQYLHEIIADFGEETTGVFLKAHLDRAKAHIKNGYPYVDVERMVPMEVAWRRESNTKVIIGVDWDKYGAGVNLVMVGVNYAELDGGDINKGRVRVIGRWEVPRGINTLTDAKEFLKTLWIRFQPDAIYIDRGFGEMQYEELMREGKEGTDERAAGIQHVLKGIHFAESVYVFDPSSNEEVKKEIKDYMVTLCIKLFEEDRIILNDRDYEEVPGPTDMIAQFEGYQVVRKTMTGRPVYEAANSNIGDHALDAFMLCILAMHQEWGPFSMPISKARPKSVDFSLTDMYAGEKIDLSKQDDDRPERFYLSRSNVGRKSRSRGRGGNRLQRKKF